MRNNGSHGLVAARSPVTDRCLSIPVLMAHFAAGDGGDGGGGGTGDGAFWMPSRDLIVSDLGS
jgi:hypothetical protein